MTTTLIISSVLCAVSLSALAHVIVCQVKTDRRLKETHALLDITHMLLKTIQAMLNSVEASLRVKRHRIHSLDSRMQSLEDQVKHLKAAHGALKKHNRAMAALHDSTLEVSE